MTDLLAALRDFDALRPGDDLQTNSLEAIPPRYGDGSGMRRLSGRMRSALHAMQIERLYEHQEDAIQYALDGSNVVLQAPTASGKTLAFQLPLLETLMDNPAGHALMIYPTKALALDQREQLMKLTSSITGGRIDSWWYDGDTDPETRAALRKRPPHILITTPEMVNNTFLAHADLWDSFLSNLRWVIVDEMHEYRGYFGSNVSLLLRRFAFHLSKKGVSPQFFLCSATCANAREHAENLTGLEFVEVNAANSMRPWREFTFISPDIPDFRYWEILQLRTVNAALACLHAGKSLLVFCPTRKFAETCVGIAKREIERLREERSMELDPSVVRVFRAGLSAEERHEIQEGLKQGSAQLVFTTNALELGLDIGGLDGVILAGFPDSMMAAWQRIGRAGRSWRSDAFVLYFARNNPLDIFYASNLVTFLQKPLDDLVASASNEELVEKHVPALLFETEDLTEGEPILGTALFEAARAIQQSGGAPVRNTRYRPHQAVDLRGAGGQRFVVRDGEAEIGTLSGQQQFREAYQRAIYLHGGRRYRVNEISLTGDGGEISLSTAEPYLRTDAKLFTMLTEQDIFAGNRWSRNGSAVSTFYGKVLMTETMTAVEEINEQTGEVVDRWVPSNNAARFANAHACWVCLETESQEMADAFVTLQHLLRVGALFTIPLDSHDIGPHCDVKQQKAYLVESYPGGIGIARKALQRWQDILKAGIQVASSCSCRRGCPNCVVPPRSRDEIDKVKGIALAEELMGIAQEGQHATIESGLWKPVA